MSGGRHSRDPGVPDDDHRPFHTDQLDLAALRRSLRAGPVDDTESEPAGDGVDDAAVDGHPDDVDRHGDDDGPDADVTAHDDGPDADASDDDDDEGEDPFTSTFGDVLDGHPPRRRVWRTIRRVLATLVTLAVLAGIGFGVVYVVQQWRSDTIPPADWAGEGTDSIVVRIHSGDGLYDLGGTLVAAGVVADAKTFVDTAVDDGALAALHPGYYRVRLHSSAQSAVEALADPANRLGQLRIIPGQTVTDLTAVDTDGNTTVRPGILSTIAAACVPTEGERECFTVDELRAAAETAGPNELGVVAWAVDGMAAAPDPIRRLEGLILPGDYDIAPGSTAQEALTAVVSASAARWNTTDIVTAADTVGLTPYQLATVASLVQAEGIGDDMPKVARVIYNRLDIDMKLQFDSTVNYGLGRAQISTAESERLDPNNRYSTYAHHGLPPTPIGAPGPDALEAATHPAIGDWLYFVAIDLEGHSCFSETVEEHQECVDIARANGVFG